MNIAECSVLLFAEFVRALSTSLPLFAPEKATVPSTSGLLPSAGVFGSKMADVVVLLLAALTLFTGEI